MKRVFDVAVVLLVAPFAAAIAGGMAVALAAGFRGNPLYAQQRTGLHELPFRMYKLRTMRHAKPGEQKAHVIDNWDTYVFSPAGVSEPRLTRLGAFARKTSIDELPNLVNVFLGQMSLVGPRPELPEIVAQYPPKYRRRHDVRPGIAGLAQANGRSNLAYDAIMQYDLAYVDSRSFWLDLRILWKTVVAVAAGVGAR